MDQVLAAHNAWADSIKKVWSKSVTTVDVPDPEKAGRRAKYDLDGFLNLVLPDRLFLRGQIGAIAPVVVLEVGMNPERYWIWVKPKVNTIWTGRRGGLGERWYDVSLDDLMTALGMFPVRVDSPDSFDFATEPQQYVLTESREQGGRVLPWRRTWFDRRTLRPVRIDLYQFGKTILMSELLAYDRVGGTDVCCTYRIRFYGQAEAYLALRLSDLSLTRDINMKIFQYRVPPGAEVKDLDARPANAGSDAPAGDATP
jgi:hypothetical protein